MGKNRNSKVLNSLQNENKDLLEQTPASKYDVLCLAEEIQSLDASKSISERSMKLHCTNRSGQIEKSLKDLSKAFKDSQIINTRNGSSKKTDRDIRDVIKEVHEGTYFLVPFGRLMMHIYDFTTTNKKTAVLLLIIFFFLRDLLWKALLFIVDKPPEILTKFFEFITKGG